MLGRTADRAWAVDYSCGTELVVSAYVTSRLDRAYLVKITTEVEVVLCPNALQSPDEFITSSADDSVYISGESTVNSRTCISHHGQATTVRWQ